MSRRVFLAIALALVVPVLSTVGQQLWSIDLQGTGSPALMSGPESTFQLGGVWNAFNAAHHPATSTNPAIANLVDSTGAVTPVSFAITGIISGFNNAGDPMKGDYVFINAGSADRNITWQLAGLTPNAVYEIFVFAGSIDGRFFNMQIDANANGSLADEPVERISRGGRAFRSIRADASGVIRGNALNAGVEGNWSGLHVRAARAGGAVLAGAGTQLGARDSLRSFEIPKPLDANGDDVYGSDGFVFFNLGANNTSVDPLFQAAISLPSFVEAFTPGPGTYSCGDCGQGYQAVDDPRLPPAPAVANVDSGVLALAGSGGNEVLLCSFTMGAGVPAGGFRVGLLTDNADSGSLNPASLRLAGAGSDSSFVVLTNHNLNNDLVFFEITGASPGEVFNVFGTLQAGSGLITIGGVLFDALASIGPPVPLSQTGDLTVVEGTPARFQVVLANPYGAFHRWQRDGVDVPGEVGPVLTLPTAKLSDSGAVFQCFITNRLGATSSAPATLTVVPDTFAPQLISVQSLGDTERLTVVFSELVDPVTAVDPGNYSIAPGGQRVLGARLSADGRTVVLTTTRLSSGVDYIVTVNGVRDRAQVPNTALSVTAGFSLDFTPADLALIRPVSEPIGPSSRRTPLVLSEIHYHPAARADGRNLEFIEIFNTQPWQEDLGGFRLTGAVDYTFPSNTLIGARAYLVVAAVPADVEAVHGISGVLGPFAGSNGLQNSSGTVRLQNRTGAVLLEVKYSGEPPWPVAADGAGHSLVLARPSYGEGDPKSWSASAWPGGSPGRAEPAVTDPFAAVMINELLANTAAPQMDFIELYNYSTQAVDLAGCFLTDDPATNKFRLPTGTVIEPLGFRVWFEDALGFALSSSGETIYLRGPDGQRVIDVVRFPAQALGVAMGRTPDGSAGFSSLNEPTPGAGNSGARWPAVIFNEIHYHPISGNPDDEFVELFNRGTDSVNLGGWRIRGGISFNVPAGVVLPAGGYVVVARNTTRLLSRGYAGLSAANTLGNFSGSLSARGETLTLLYPEVTSGTNATGQPFTNTLYAVENEVTYPGGGSWSHWSDGGGSSLELVDAHSDNRLMANWADSDETGKSGWATVEWTGVLDLGLTTPDSLQIFLQGEGECVVDNVEVVGTNGVNLVANANFEAGSAGWSFQGTQHRSAVESGVGFNGSAGLHLRASGRGDTGANRVRVPLTTNLIAAQLVTLRAKVRWLTGHPEILLRLHGNWLEAAGYHLLATNLGSPGAPNSRSASNLGPAISDVAHQPMLPAADEPVTVTARVRDPDGLLALELKYRVDPSSTVNVVPMVYRGAGIYSGVIPGQRSGRLAAFRVEALDAAPAPRASVYPPGAPQKECLVGWGESVPPGVFGSYKVWVTQSTLQEWSMREKNSNEPLDATFCYGGFRVVYNMGALYSGSPFHTPGFDTPLGRPCDYVLHFPDDNRVLGAGEFLIAGPGTFGDDLTAQREQTMYWIARQLGMPFYHRRFVHFFLNGQRRSLIMEDAQQANGDFVSQWFPNDDQGDLHKGQDWIEFDAAGGGFDSLDRATLENFTTTGGQKKVARYRWVWAPRAVQGLVNDFTNLFQLVDTLALTTVDAYTAQTEAIVDVDEWMRALVLQRIAGNWDSWGYTYGKNMYLYKPERGRWAVVPWDIDFSLGLVGDAPTTDLFAPNADPVCAKFTAHPPFRRALWRVFLDAANGPMLAARVNPMLDEHYAALLANGVNASPPDPVKTYISQRRDYILGQAITVNAPFVVNGTNSLATNRNLIQLSGTAPAAAQTITVNGIAYPITWTNTLNWILRVPLQAGTNVLTLQLVDRAGQPLTNAPRVVTIRFTGDDPAPQDAVAINEIHYNPLIPGASYVELLNRSTNSSFDLSGWRLDGVDFTFPAGSLITNRQVLVVARDALAFTRAFGLAQPLAGEYAGELRGDGEVLSLLKPGPAGAAPQVIDRVRYEPGAPWPGAANGAGASLQLVDPAQDRSRVSNWSDGSGWRYFSFTGTTPSGRVSFVFEPTGGDAYLDDLSLVAGPVAGVGRNLLVNGDFESPLGAPWTIASFAANSHLTNGVVHRGSNSLHLIEGQTAPSASLFYQDVVGLITNSVYTLSGWCLPGSKGTNLALRTSSAFQARPSLRPVAPTPGAFNLTAGPIEPFPTLWLNEVFPNNAAGAADAMGDRDPWIEIHNSGILPVRLDGCYLSASYTNLSEWAFPPNIEIAPGGFLVVWTDGEPNESSLTELHTSFRLPPGHGQVALSQALDGPLRLVDYLNYPALRPDESYGDVPDGQPFFRQVSRTGTPGAANDPVAAPPPIVINEWVAANTAAGGTPDPADGRYDDWFELYNPSTESVNLAGYYLTDNLGAPRQFRIPEGYTVGPRGFLVVWADNEIAQNSPSRADLHVNFQLARGGEAIGLFDPDGARVDAVSFGSQLDNVSSGRYPDGLGTERVLSRPTPGGPNAAPRNRAPVLAPIADRTLYLGETLALTLAATDPDLPGQTLAFGLEQGPTGLVLTGAGGELTWTPTAGQVPGTNQVRVRVLDDGVPPLGATQSCVVVVLPPPVLAVAAGGAGVSFSALSNRAYTIEWRESVDHGRWSKLADVVSRPTNRIARVEDARPAADGRLYRLVTPVRPDGPPGPMILRSPRSVLAQPGEDVVFDVLAVSAGGSGSMSYQWLFNGVPIDGATLSNLVLAGVSFEHSGAYGVRVTDATGQSTNQPAALLGVRPRIVDEPQDEDVAAGSTVVFSVNAQGVDPLAYQWVRNGKPLVGEKSRTLTLTGVKTGDRGSYQVSVSHPTPLGRAAVWSRVAVLSVR